MNVLSTLPLARRGFLARLTAAAGAAALLAAPRPLPAARPAPRHAARAAGDDGPDAWIGRLTGRDRLVVHTHERLLTALAAAHGILRDAGSGYGVPEDENSIAVAAHGPAIGGLLTDDAWRRFALGERYAPAGAGRAPAPANPFLRPQADAPPEATVPALLARGVVFVACDVAVRNLARRVAGEGRPWEATHEALLAGMLPGVVVVPNVFVAISHAQQRGIGYLYIG